MTTIETRTKCTLGATVERVYEGDKLSVTLAGFEFGYQAEMFAKALSKESDGAIIVRGFNRTYIDDVYIGGKKIRAKDHWTSQLVWSDNAK